MIRRILIGVLLLWSFQGLAETGVQLRIGSGDCKGDYQAPKFLESGEYNLAAVGAGCDQAAKVTYDQSEEQGVKLEFIGVKYLASTPPGGINGLVLDMPAPEASRISVSSDVNGFWTEAHYLKEFRKLPRDTQFILWQDRAGNYGAMIPLVGGGGRSVINGRDGRILIQSSSWMESFIPDEVPLVAIAQGPDPYQVIDRLYAYAMLKMKAPGKLRAEKKFPEVFNYIGWCSWNAYYRAIDEKKILAAAKSFKQKNFPVGFFIIDDGWLATKPPRTSRQSSGKAYLVDFEADQVTFPHGLAGLTQSVKNTGVKYVGLWHTMQGYWDGVLTDSDLGRKEADALFPIDELASIPNPLGGRGEKFYSDWFEFMKQSGVDFVKVDNQGTLRTLVKDKLPIGYAMAGEQDNLQKAAGKYFEFNLINCMEMNIDAVYNYWGANIGRTSNDYIPKLTTNPRAHVHRNLMNALWFSQLNYPDYDMFQTYNPGALMHAVARAISGGPIYITDLPGRQKLGVLRPLIFSDGRILQPDLPALPTQDSLFGNPRTQNKPLKAFAKAGEAGILAAFNVNKSGLPVTGSFAPSDVHGISGMTFAVYDHFGKKLYNLGLNDRKKFMLETDGAKIWIIRPVRKGFAAIGLGEKYISPKAILEETVSENSARVKLYEGGEFLAWCERRPWRVLADGREVPEAAISWEDNALRVDLSSYRGKAVELLLKF